MWTPPTDMEMRIGLEGAQRVGAALDMRDRELYRHRQAETPPLPFRVFNGAWKALYFNHKEWRVTPDTVAQLTAKELMAEDDFGRASLVKVKAWLASYGLTLREAD